MTADLDEFYSYYAKLDSENVNKHFYEHIHPEKPCRLYFDLEFNRLFNPDMIEEKIFFSRFLHTTK